MKKLILGMFLLTSVIYGLTTVQTAAAQTLITPNSSSPSDLDNFIDLHNLQESPIKSFEESSADIVLKFGEPSASNERVNYRKSFDIIGKEIGSALFEDGVMQEQTSYIRQSNSESKYSYDSDGNVIERYDTDFNTTGERRIWTLFEGDNTAFTWQYTYTYGADGLPLSVTKYFPDGSVDILASFNYDEAGNKITEAYYNADGKFYRLERYSYEGDNLVEETYYDGENNLTGNNKYSFDAQGNLLSAAKFDVDKSLLSEKKYEYDDNNNRIKEQSYNREGELTQQTNYSFDDNGNKLSETLYDSEGEQILQQTLAYDDSGQLIEKFYYNADGTVDRGFEYSYTEAGEILETKNYIFGGAHFSTDVCEYKNLDSYGNWTERNCVLFKRVSGEFQADYGVSDSETTIRKIEYFE